MRVREMLYGQNHEGFRGGVGEGGGGEGGRGIIVLKASHQSQETFHNFVTSIYTAVECKMNEHSQSQPNRQLQHDQKCPPTRANLAG